MNILLVNQYLNNTLEPIIPIGLCSLATCIKTYTNNKVIVFDPNVEDHWEEALVKTIRKFKPDLIGVSFRNIDSTLFIKPFNYFPLIKKLLIILRSNCPEALIIIGGSGASVFPCEILNKIPQVDACISGTGEESIIKIIQHPFQWEQIPGAYYRDNNSGDILLSSSLKTIKFAELPFPRRDYIKVERYLSNKYSTGILTKRGCEKNCIYCIYPFVSGHSIETRPVDHVVEEIEYLQKDFQVEYLYVSDNVFNNPRHSMMELCQSIIKKNIKIKWTAFFDCFEKNIDKNIIDLVKKAGCICIQSSPEAYPQNYLNIFKKGLTQKEVIRFIKLFDNEKEIEVLIDFFAEAPGQKFTDFLRMVYLMGIYSLKFTIQKQQTTFKLHPIRIYPKTQLFEMAVSANYISKNIDLLPNSDKLDESLFYLTFTKKIIYKFLLRISNFLQYKSQPKNI